MPQPGSVSKTCAVWLSLQLAHRELVEAVLALGVGPVDALHGGGPAEHVRDQAPVGDAVARQHTKLVHDRTQQRVLLVAPRLRLPRRAPPPGLWQGEAGLQGSCHTLQCLLLYKLAFYHQVLLALQAQAERPRAER